MRKTKIICTIGPASEKETILRKLIENGMDCARLNFSHDPHDIQKERMDLVKRLRKEYKKPIPILLDTRGPEIRIKEFGEGKVILEEGQSFTLTTGDRPGNKESVAVTYENLAEFVKTGTLILIDDGLIAMEAVDIKDKDIICRVCNGGKLSNKKSINIPNVSIPMEYLNDKDKKDILFGIEQEVDFIAASFIRSENDILALRSFLDEHGGSKIKIISKVENQEGIRNLDEIIDLSDGVMVARGDLGVEISMKYLPAIQKDMIRKCNKKGIHVITATQMLDSMTVNPRPTRAEVSDVANAIYDGSTMIMLSGETAMGKYPGAAVKTMSEIAECAENSLEYKEKYKKVDLEIEMDFAGAITAAACNAASAIKAKAIVAMSSTGRTVQLLASHRPDCPIIAVVTDEQRARQINIAWSVLSMYGTEQFSSDQTFLHAVEKAKESGLVKKSDILVIVAGSTTQKGKPSDMIKIYEVE